MDPSKAEWWRWRERLNVAMIQPSSEAGGGDGDVVFFIFTLWVPCLFLKGLDASCREVCYRR